MNKLMRILLALGLILAVAAPAFAEFKFNGYYRLIGYAEEKKTTSDDNETQQFIDQRFRAKLTYTLNDNVAVVYFAEIDTPWGEPGKAASSQGGMSDSFAGGADGVNVETKNVYLDLKFGNTAAQLGIIGVADNVQSIVANDDMAAVQVTHKIDNTALKFAYSKWDENVKNNTTSTVQCDGFFCNDGDNIAITTTTSGQRDEWDDFDFYLFEVNQKFSDSFNAGANFYWMDDNRVGEGNNVYFYGLNAAFKSGDFGIDGFVVAQDGSNEETDVDYTGFAASAKGTMKIANGDLGLRLIYFTDDDDDEDQGRWQGFKGQYAFVSENQMQFLCDPYVMNDSKERYAENDAIGAGYGLFAAVLSGNHNLPNNLYLKWGAGYYTALADERDDESSASREGKTLGYELAARIGTKVFEKVDVSLNGSYAGYGSFYDNSAAGDDPDATYKTYLMVNVPF